MAMLNKWNYDKEGEVCYGEEAVYKKAADFLVDNVEDWGCGTGWAGHYFTNYKGIDGSPSGIVTELTDLEKYISTADNVMLRQVLEHNAGWKNILVNAVKSFQKKLFIGIHTPFTDPLSLDKDTKTIYVSAYNGVLDISFNEQDILDCLKGLKVTKEEVPNTKWEYGNETIFYVEKI